MQVGVGRFQFNRAGQELDRSFVLIHLMCQHRQHMEGEDMVRIDSEDLAIHRIRLAQLPRLMVTQRLFVELFSAWLYHNEIIGDFHTIGAK